MIQFCQGPWRNGHAVEVETPRAIEIEKIRHVELEAVRAHHRAGDAPFAAEEAARLDLKLFARGNGADKHRGAAGSERGDAFAEQVGASDCIESIIDTAALVAEIGRASLRERVCQYG